MDLLPSAFGSGSSPMGFSADTGPKVGDHRERAVLFLFKPHDRQFGDVGMRPFQYQFDGNFTALTAELTDLSQRGTASHGALIADFNRHTNLSNYIAPSQQVDMQFAASKLSDRYRFILVLTDNGSSLVNGNTLASTLGQQNIRRIYSGYFEDEPLNFATLTDNSRALNENAFMVITHKTRIATRSESGMHGTSTRVNTTASEEYFHAPITEGLMQYANNDNILHLLTPENIFESIDVTSDGYGAAVPGADCQLTGEKDVRVVNSVFEQPGEHMKMIMNGMMKYTDHVSAAGRLASNRMDGVFENGFMESEAGRARMVQYMSLPQSRPMGMFDLEVNKRYSAASIDQMLGGQLTIQTYDQPRPMFYDTADQAVQDFTNQYSYLVAMVVVPVLHSGGINRMEFSYEAAERQGRFVDNFVTASMEAQWVLTADEYRRKQIAIQNELTESIFRTIYDTLGAFALQVKADVTGMTIVRLDLVDQGLRAQADFEIPSCLGGLIAPLIGNHLNYTHNSEQVLGMYTAAAGIKGGLDGFNQDDHDFMNLATPQNVLDLPSFRPENRSHHRDDYGSGFDQD